MFPHLAGCVDDLCVINSMHGSNSRHGGALLELHTGSDTFVRPSMGSWISYGLGTENQNLPCYITICPNLSHGGVNNWSSAFLPAVYQGTPIGATGIGSERAKIPFIANTATPRKLQRLNLDMIQEMNRDHLEQSGADPALEGRIASFELAFRMQTAAPEIQDISNESAATQRLYGLDERPTREFGRQCLMARRFAESGVRFVQVSHSYKWDQHSGLKKDVARNSLEVDRPIAGLLKDLKARGLLEDTLVLWGGEFGRTPTSEGDDGRDHNPHGYTMWMAGGGIKNGMVLRQDRRLRLLFGREEGPRPRPARDHPPPARSRPHPADLPIRRPGLPPDRRPRRSRPRDPELIPTWAACSAAGESLTIGTVPSSSSAEPSSGK